MVTVQVIVTRNTSGNQEAEQVAEGALGAQARLLRALVPPPCPRWQKNASLGSSDTFLRHLKYLSVYLHCVSNKSIFKSQRIVQGGLAAGSLRGSDHDRQQ